jgi:hypothetical protein
MVYKWLRRFEVEGRRDTGDADRARSAGRR